MGVGLFSISVSGLRAAQLGLTTTQHNIANADTPGYSRQRTIQTTNSPIMTGAGSVGQGTRVSDIERLYNQLYVNQVNAAQTSVSELDTYYSQIKQIDNLLADPASGLSPVIQEFFRGVQTVAANPALMAARQSLLSSASALTARFRSTEGRINELYGNVNSDLKSTVNSINSYAQQIAEINQRIVLAQGATGHEANDLLDQRENLVSELNKLVEVHTLEASDGSYSVLYGNGQALVVGTNVSRLAVQGSSADNSRMAVGQITAGGTFLELPEQVFSGGSLTGLLTFRSETLDKTANDLGRLAATLSLTFNAQHALGQDLLGQVAGVGSFVSDFFQISSPQVIANSFNTGTSSVTASFAPPVAAPGGGYYTNLTNSDYRFSFDGTNYQLIRLSDNQSWTDTTVAGLSTTVSAAEGFTLAATVGMAAGDSFLVMPTRTVARNIVVNNTVASDPRLVAAAAPIRTVAPTTNTGKGVATSGVVSDGYSLAALPVTVSYNAATNELTGFPGGPITYNPAGTTVSFNGLSFNVTGSLNDNDQFRLEANTGGVTDNRNALLLGKLQLQPTVAGGTSSYQDAFARLVSDVGNKTREVRAVGDAQVALLKQSQDLRESLSGVNLDEEGVNLLRYQQAYQASAKAIQIGNELFDAIISIRA